MFYSVKINLNNANKIFKPLLKYPQNKTTLWYEN